MAYLVRSGFAHGCGGIEEVATKPVLIFFLDPHLLVIPQDGSFNFLMAKKENKMISIPQHLMMNVLAKRASKKKLYKKDGRCKWDAEDLKIAEKGMCVAEDLVKTIVPYARAHADKLAQAVSRE